MPQVDDLSQMKQGQAATEKKTHNFTIKAKDDPVETSSMGTRWN